MPCWPILFRQIRPAGGSGCRWGAVRSARRPRSPARLRPTTAAPPAPATSPVERWFAFPRRLAGWCRRRGSRSAVAPSVWIRGTWSPGALRVPPCGPLRSALTRPRRPGLRRCAACGRPLFLPAATASSATAPPTGLGRLRRGVGGPGAILSLRLSSRDDACQSPRAAAACSLVARRRGLLFQPRLKLTEPLLHRPLDLRPRRARLLGPNARTVGTNSFRRRIGVGRFRFDRDLRREFGHLRQC